MIGFELKRRLFGMSTQDVSTAIHLQLKLVAIMIEQQQQK